MYESIISVGNIVVEYSTNFKECPGYPGLIDNQILHTHYITADNVKPVK